MRDLRGKVALVTGSSTGIGAAVAIGLAANGCRVALHYGSQHEAAAAVMEQIVGAGGEAAVFQADVNDTAAIDAWLEHVLGQFGRIDILVNNAGSIVERTKLLEADDRLIDTSSISMHAPSWRCAGRCCRRCSGGGAGR